MGRRGIWSSAAAGASLVVAALILVAAVSTLIAFRGFRGVQATAPASQSVVIDPTAAREHGNAAVPKPKAVVIGGARTAPAPAVARKRRSGRAARSRTGARRTAPARAHVSEQPLRSGLSAPAVKPSKSSPAPAATPQREADPPAAAPTAPVDKVVDDVAGVVEDVSGVEKVGDVLLDVRDLLP